MNSISNMPLVSICCITYNHARYIRNAIDGFLLQKTNFPIEIIIHDDASTDETQCIINEYAKRYPDLIFPIYQTRNQHSRGIKTLPTFVFPRARGKYIALCEGDDYWIDPNKLSLQVSFLETHPDFAGCCHACKIFYVDINKFKPVYLPRPHEITFEHYLENNLYISTASLIFNRHIIDPYPDWALGLFAADFVIKYLILANGKMQYFNMLMSVYRKGVLGSWSKQPTTQKRIDREYFDNMLALFEMNKQTHFKHQKSILSRSKINFSRYLARSIALTKGQQKFMFLLRHFHLLTIRDYKLLAKQLF